MDIFAEISRGHQCKWWLLKGPQLLSVGSSINLIALSENSNNKINKACLLLLFKHNISNNKNIFTVKVSNFKTTFLSHFILVVGDAQTWHLQIDTGAVANEDKVAWTNDLTVLLELTGFCTVSKNRNGFEIGDLGTNARNRQDTILNRWASYGLGAKVNS